MNENVRISINISLKFVPKGLINNIPALAQIMAWRRLGDKPLSEPMVVILLTRICVSRPQWVMQCIPIKYAHVAVVVLRTVGVISSHAWCYTWKRFPCYWPFDSPRKGSVTRTLMLALKQIVQGRELPVILDAAYHKLSNTRRTKSQNLNVSRLGLQLSSHNILKQCSVENEDWVRAAPTGDAPTTSEWSTISLPTQVHLILETWRYVICGFEWIIPILILQFRFTCHRVTHYQRSTTTRYV